MSYYNTRKLVIDSLVDEYEKHKDLDFGEPQVRGMIHKRTSDLLYALRCAGQFHDHQVQVRFKDFMDPSAGLEVEISIWPEQGQPSDRFVLFVLPADSEPDDNDDHLDAYARAMSIL